MKKDFREKIIQKCMEPAKKYGFLKYPCLALVVILLCIHGVQMHFITNGRRYIGIAFALLFFMSSCSFSFAVFSGQVSFMDTQETYNAIVEDSDVAFAVEQTVAASESLAEEEPLKEYESSEYIENTDFYTLDELLEDVGAYASDMIDENTEESQAQESQDGLSQEEANVEETLPEEGIPVFESDDWRLILINKQHPIPDEYGFELGIIKDNMKCDKRILPDLFAMLQAAKDDGIILNISSPYRTDDRQMSNFNRRIEKYMNQGYSYMEAYKTASRTITIPGASEHEVGLALDITSNAYSRLDEAFGGTEAGKWLKEHSCEYGFILRYPEGKEYITSIEYEPWHFRYVGKDAAVIMTQENICLEEFWDKYL